MSREDEIKNTLKKEKKPSSKKYLIILFVILMALVGYLALTGELQNVINFVKLGASNAVGGNAISNSVTNPAEAGQINSNLGTGLQNASNVLDDISNVLG